MHVSGPPVQRAAFPPAREILPPARDAGVIAAPGPGNAARRTIPVSPPPVQGRGQAQEVHMKIVRWVAAAALTLMSLMDIGTVGDSGGAIADRTLVPLLGVLGLIAVYGLLRRRRWGTPAALAASAVNAVGALIALALNSDGALIALAFSTVALVLTAITAHAGRDGQADRAGSPQTQPAGRASA
jgi:peptidoglycan/LPS O-acetylase OafA/YrhL